MAESWTGERVYRRSGFHGIVLIGLVGSYLDTHDYGLVCGAGGEGDDDLAAAVSGGVEGLHQGRVFPDRAIDVKVGEDRRSVDGHVEFTAPRLR